MKAIDEFPPSDHPLREKLPAMRISTREALLEWGVAQPGALAWLLQRGALYWDRFVSLDAKVDMRLCDATAALDLLKWRIEATQDREAIQHLETLREHGEHLKNKRP